MLRLFRRHRSICLTLIVLTAGWGVGCRAVRAPVTPQRPTFSSDTNTTAVGTVELEAGGAVDPRDSFDSPLTLKVGVSERSEFFVGWSPYQWVETEGSDGRGASDTLIGTRQRIVDPTESGRPSVAVQLATKLPTGSEREGLSSGEIDFFAAGIVSTELSGFGVTGFYQMGFLGEPDDSEFDLEHGIALAVGRPIFGATSAFGEIAARVAHEQDRDELFTTLGIAHAITPSLVLDTSVVVGLNRDAQDFQILFGFTYNFGRIDSWFVGDRTVR